MEFHRQFSTFILTTALACAPALVCGQQNNNQQHQNNNSQHEVRQAPKQSKDAARNGGQTTKKATSNAHHQTSRGTSNAWSKTKTPPRGTTHTGKQGAQKPQ